MKHAMILLAAFALAGCTNRSGTAFIEIENDQRMQSSRAEPVWIDPRVEVTHNEFSRSYINEGSNIKQKITIKGPFMIVPVPATMPSSTQPIKR